MTVAQIAVSAAPYWIDRPYDYLVPEELRGKALPGAPHEVLLVLDASTGQNAFQQAKEFARATTITSLAVTKLDGTAKGGVVVGLTDMFHVPVRFIGTGEGLSDLRPFNREEFVKDLFNPEDLKK